MKIGILTYHRSINYGAVTQCYALVNEIKKRFPEYDVEVIDYTPQFRIDAYKPTLFRHIFGNNPTLKSSIKNIRIIIYKIIKLLLFPCFFKLERVKYKAFQHSMTFLPLSKKSYRHENVEDFCKEIAGEYDVIVVGSDCVWEWSTVPFPNAYYLCGDFKAKKVTFAASAGVDQVEELTYNKRKQMIESVKDFSYIGVRDTSTEYVVKQLCPDAVIHHNCDPTTFLDISLLKPYKERVLQKLRDAGITNEKPIVAIMGNSKISKLAYKIFGDSVYYVGLYCVNLKNDINLMDLNVLEWASAFGLFDLTFTTFFHGTMLSLVNQTPVISIDYLPENDNQITKLHELYNRLELNGFYWRDKEEYTDDDIYKMSEIAQKLIKNPPKEKIKEELQKEAEYCESFFEYLKTIKSDKDTI